jgi:ubiquinone/menaquinone biosynthesis C-methylase UbiE
VVFYNRCLQRTKLFDEKVRRDLRGKIVTEVGCGDPRGLFAYLNPGELGFKYVGIDSSEESLRIGLDTNLGMYVQSDVCALPIASRCVDAILCFGVLMYLENWRIGLQEIFRVLDEGGTLYLYEKLARSRRTGDKKLHQSHILEGEFYNALKSQGTITLWRKDYSPIRYILVMLIERFTPMTRALAKLVIAIDYSIIATLGKIIPWFGGRAVFAKVEKRRTS